MKITRILALFVLAFSLSFESLLAGGSWTRKSDMPTARFGLSASVVNDRIYAIGGATGPNQDLRTVEEYDPATDSWTKKADMPNTRCWHSTSVMNGKTYVIGGYAAGVISGMVEEYDPATDTWIRKADMPTPRWLLSTSVVNGKIYAIGGANDSVDPFSTVEEYDPLTNTWTRKSNMPIRRFALSTSAVDGKIYVIGGASDWQIFVRAVDEYDPATDTWVRRADIPTARWWLSTSTLNGKVYAIGGCVDVHGVTFPTVEGYDPVTDTWTQEVDMPTPRKALATSEVNGKIYAIGGSTVPHWNVGFSMVEEYDTTPLPDFNSDGVVDLDDLVIMIESWNTDDPLCDIAPPPDGDGVVDRLDLELLMSYWGQEIYDPTLIAHWKLDELNGDTAFDSAGDFDGTLYGGPLWQPNGGFKDGALEFDGMDDYISTPLVLDMAVNPFSVFIWIKGDVPGQVIFSQANRSDWLATGLTDGNLITELRFLGKASQLLQSQALVTDGQWHHVGLVWDGTNRILYVDDMEVASDTYGTGFISGDLQIGVGNKLESGTFWSGLIDDVRIYNRAITP